jgi:ribosomal protein S18 acetylase RimI-like enzyme
MVGKCLFGGPSTPPRGRSPVRKNIKLRRANSRSVSRSVSLLRDSFNLSPEATADAKYELTLDNRDGSARVFNAYDESVASLSNKANPIGTIVSRFFNSIASSKPEAVYIESQAVSPKYRGKGIGPNLVQKALSEYSLEIPVAVHLGKEPKNEAQLAEWGYRGFSVVNSSELPKSFDDYPELLSHIKETQKYAKAKGKDGPRILSVRVPPVTK